MFKTTFKIKKDPYFQGLNLERKGGLKKELRGKSFKKK